ncbi:hypothetical protein [Streptomyces sp. bgisy027]|uniref:hypothetical protein n=1 Tax=Streptomyces sp. bgisy027 TaxID=3413770 RepID=UPI003D72F694
MPAILGSVTRERYDELVNISPPSTNRAPVTGTWIPQGKLGSDQACPPVLSATGCEAIEQPANPYAQR